MCIFAVTVAELLEGEGLLVMFELADNATADSLTDILQASSLLVEADQVGRLFSDHAQIEAYRDQVGTQVICFLFVVITSH